MQKIEAREQSKNKQKPRKLSTQPNINCKVMKALEFLGSLFSLMKVTAMWHLPTCTSASLWHYAALVLMMYDIMTFRNPTEARFDTSEVSDSRGRGKTN